MLARHSFLVGIKWVVFLLLSLVLLSLQTASHLFEIFGSKPLLLVPFCVCISVFFGDKDGALLALFCGGIWDAAAGKLLGFSSFMLMACCIACAFFVMYLIRANLINTIFLTAGTLILYYLFYFVFNFLIWEYENVWVLLLYEILPTMAYTLLVTPLFYFLCRFLYRKFQFKD